MAAVGACDEPTDAVVNLWRTTNFTLCELPRFLSVLVFEKTLLSCVLQPDMEIQGMRLDADQVNLFIFWLDTTAI